MDENKVIEICGESKIRASDESRSATKLEVQLPKLEGIDARGFKFVNVIEEEAPIEFLSLYFN